MDRFDFANKLLNIIDYQIYGSVFGGYIRDLVKKKPFDDIDILVMNDYDVNDVNTIIIPNILEYTSTTCGDISHLKNKDFEKVTSIFRLKDRSTVPVDFIIPSKDGGDNSFETNLISVNSLSYEYELKEVLVLCEGMKWDAKEIYSHIENNKFDTSGDVSEDRILNIIQKGYSPIN